MSHGSDTAAPPKRQPVDLARAGYEGYATFTGGKTYDGRDMPKWDDLTDKIKGAWSAAIEAALKALDP